MNKLGLILLMSLATGTAYAQNPNGDITTSTDPAKAAAVEKHAQELQAQQSKEASSKHAAAHTSSHTTKAKAPAKHKSSSAKPAKQTKS